MLGMSRAIGETMVVLMVAGGAAILPETIFDPVRPMPPHRGGNGRSAVP